MPAESPDLQPSSAAALQERGHDAPKKGFSVTHTSFSAPPVGFPAGGLSPYSSSRGTTPPLNPRSPSASQGSVPMSPLGELPAAASMAEDRTIEDIEASTAAARASPASAARSTPSPNLGPSVGKSAVVPLITPRYQKKSRTNRGMQVTDSVPEHRLPSQELGHTTTETLTIVNGPQQYEQQMEFRTYDVYRHGKHKIISRSVGYSSDGDLVMTREDLSEPSDVDLGYNRRQTEIHPPTVLDSRARRPLTDSELQSKRKIRINRPRYKKYPGIHAPRDRKKLNRLHNEHHLHAFAYHLRSRALAARSGAATDGGEGDDDDDDDDDINGHEHRVMAPSHPTTGFADMPAAMRNALDMKDNRQDEELIRIGALRAPPGNHLGTGKDPRGGEVRFQQLNQRLRGELQHALTSAFLARQIEDLEVCFVNFIKGGPTTRRLVFRFRDGYGRLVCHGVAAYYTLQSESHLTDDGEEKLTCVSFPGSRKRGVKPLAVPYTPLLAILRRKSKNMPAHHSLSANVSPAITPQQSPQLAPAPPPPAGSMKSDSTANAAPLPALAVDDDFSLGGCTGDEDGAKEAEETLRARCQVAANTTVFLTDDDGEIVLPFARMPIYEPQSRINLANYAESEDLSEDP